MSIIKNVAACIVASGLLLSSTAYASETRSDSFAPKASAQPLTVAHTTKLKRRTQAVSDYSSAAIDPTTGLIITGIAGLGAGFAIGRSISH
jgi:hypothetical protein